MNCDHPGCKCPPQDVMKGEKRYCSEACAAAGNEKTPGGCRCGHSSCAERMAERGATPVI